VQGSVFIGARFVVLANRQTDRHRPNSVLNLISGVVSSRDRSYVHVCIVYRPLDVASSALVQQVALQQNSVHCFLGSHIQSFSSSSSCYGSYTRVLHVQSRRRVTDGYSVKVKGKGRFSGFIRH
jgi:hypothetical protein